MKSLSKKLGLATLGLFATLSLVGCEDKGPAQKAGEGVDKAAKDIRESVVPRGPVEKAGAGVDKAVGNK